MSQIVSTQFGRFRHVAEGDGRTSWLWECPGCQTWCRLSERQWAGEVSIDHATDGCPGQYHQTHNFGAELVAVMQARILTGSPPIDTEPDGIRKDGTP